MGVLMLPTKASISAGVGVCENAGRAIARIATTTTEIKQIGRKRTRSPRNAVVVGAGHTDDLRDDIHPPGDQPRDSTPRTSPAKPNAKPDRRGSSRRNSPAKPKLNHTSIHSAA